MPDALANQPLVVYCRLATRSVLLRRQRLGEEFVRLLASIALSGHGSSYD